MKNLNRISEAFRGEDEGVIIICSKKLELKLNEEIANITSEISQTNGTSQRKLDAALELGIKSVSVNGVNLHYTSDLGRFHEGLKEYENENRM